MQNPLDELAAAAKASPGKPLHKDNRRFWRGLPAPFRQVRLTRLVLSAFAAIVIASLIFELGRLTSQGSLHFGGTPYAEFVDDAFRSTRECFDRLHAKYGNAEKVPDDIQEAAKADLEHELNAKVKGIKPPPIDVDPSAAGWVADAEVVQPDVSLPYLSGLTLQFYLRFTAVREIPRFDNGLRVECLDSGGAIMQEWNFSTGLSSPEPGERGRVEVSVPGEGDIARLARFRISYARRAGAK